MLKPLLFLVFTFVVVFSAKTAFAQVRTDSLSKKNNVPVPAKVDTLKPKYINPGKVAARKSAIASAILPGLGQAFNYGLLVNNKDELGRPKRHTIQKMFIIGKIGLIYGGATVLTLSFIDNNRNYHTFLEELQYRRENGDKAPPGSLYARYTTTGLTNAKDIARRNKEIVLFSYVALYAANIIDAYVDARLKFFNVDDKLSFKLTPSVINPNQMYGYNAAVPALKISLKL